MAKTKQTTPNEQRSVVKNHNNPQHEQDKTNREKQIKESQKPQKED